MFKKLIIAVTVIGSIVYAEPKMEYTISFLGMDMDYNEYDTQGTLLDSETSNFTDIAGAEFTYRFFLQNRDNLEFKITGVNGYSQYTGSYLNTNSNLIYGSVKGSTANTIYDLSFIYNMQKQIAFNTKLLGGLGLGYRFWRRELSSIQVEDYSWYSLRTNIGVEYQYNNLRTAFILEYQYGIDPTMSATGFSQDFKLSSANIVKLSFPLRYKISSRLDLTCEYSLEYQEIKESNIVYDNAQNGYVEPDSTAYNQYLKVGAIFKY